MEKEKTISVSKSTWQKLRIYSTMHEMPIKEVIKKAIELLEREDKK